MTVVSVTPTDTGRTGETWRIPGGLVNDETNIPRASRLYSGQSAIAALGAGDETSFRLTCTFPTEFVYLLQRFTLGFESDDTTEEFEAVGQLSYSGLPVGGNSINFARIPIVSDGVSYQGATTLANRRWRIDPGNPKFFITSGVSVEVTVTDMSGDTSTAGDMFWYITFLEYDVQQCLQWPSNTPQLVHSLS